MRIVSGSARGRKLVTPSGMEIRPTTDKVKEAWFSIIQFDLPGRRVLDLFAGTGQLGLEALSRGAKSCCFVEHSRKAMELVKKNIGLTGFGAASSTVFSDAFLYLSSCSETYDLVFLDPPYEMEMCAKAAALLPRVLSEDAIVICETRPAEILPAEIGALKISKVYNYSNIKLTVYRNPDPEDP